MTYMADMHAYMGENKRDMIGYISIMLTQWPGTCSKSGWLAYTWNSGFWDQTRLEIIGTYNNISYCISSIVRSCLCCEKPVYSKYRIGQYQKSLLKKKLAASKQNELWTTAKTDILIMNVDFPVSFSLFISFLAHLLFSPDLPLHLSSSS